MQELLVSLPACAVLPGAVLAANKGSCQKSPNVILGKMAGKAALLCLSGANLARRSQWIWSFRAWAWRNKCALAPPPAQVTEDARLSSRSQVHFTLLLFSAGRSGWNEYFRRWMFSVHCRCKGKSCKRLVGSSSGSVCCARSSSSVSGVLQGNQHGLACSFNAWLIL